jgi:hypothetical protein
MLLLYALSIGDGLLIFIMASSYVDPPPLPPPPLLSV